MAENLQGKKILFVSPEFFGIDRSIIKVLEAKGASVQWVNERSINSALSRAINSVSPMFFYAQSNRYFRNVVENVKDDIDIILVIKGEMISAKTIALLRSRFKNAKLNLYLFDSVKNVKGILRKVSLYDRVMSFEPGDCEKYGFEFRPLFCDFEKTQIGQIEEEKYDICFYGTMYGDRFHIVNQVREYCNDNNMKFYSFCYLRGRFMKIYYWFTNKGFRKMDKQMLSFVPKPTAELSKVVRSSNVVLDANDIHQQGLTIRTIETLVSGKKMITTNKDIVNYDFYNPSNILIIDRDNIQIDRSFFEREFVPIEPKVLEKYTAEGWVEDVF